MNWDYSRFISTLLGFYGLLATQKYNIEPGTMEVAVDILATAPGAKTGMMSELKSFVQKYRALQNNAIG